MSSPTQTQSNLRTTSYSMQINNPIEKQSINVIEELDQSHQVFTTQEHHLDRNSLVKAERKVVDHVYSKTIKCSDCKKSLLNDREEFSLVLNQSILYQGSTITHKHRRDFSYNANTNSKSFSHNLSNSSLKEKLEEENNNLPHKRKDKPTDDYQCKDRGKVNLRMYASCENIKSDLIPNEDNEIDLCFVEAFEILKKEKRMKTEHSQIEIIGYNPSSFFQSEYDTNDNNKQNISSNVKESYHAIKVITKDHLSPNEVNTISVQQCDAKHQSEPSTASPSILKGKQKPNKISTKASSPIEYNANASLNNDTLMLNSNSTKKHLIKQCILGQSHSLDNNKNKILNILNDSFVITPQEPKSELGLLKNNIKSLFNNRSQNVISITQKDNKTTTASRLETYFKYMQLKRKYKPNCNMTINNSNSYNDSFMIRNKPLNFNIRESSIFKVKNNKGKHNKSLSSIPGSIIHFTIQLPLSTSKTPIGTDTVSKEKLRFINRTIRVKVNNSQSQVDYNKKYYHIDHNSWVYPPNKVQKLKKCILNMHLQTIHEYK